MYGWQCLLDDSLSSSQGRCHNTRCTSAAVSLRVGRPRKMTLHLRVSMSAPREDATDSTTAVWPRSRIKSVSSVLVVLRGGGKGLELLKTGPRLGTRSDRVTIHVFARTWPRYKLHAVTARHTWPR